MPAFDEDTSIPNGSCAPQNTSIEHINNSELYPLSTLSKDDPSLSVSLPTLHGESYVFLDKTSDGIIAISNFRLLIQSDSQFINLPIGIIELVERDIFVLALFCKDGRSFRCSFESNEACQRWWMRVSAALAPAAKLDEIFALAYNAWLLHADKVSIEAPKSDEGTDTPFHTEVDRMCFDLKQQWRISYINDAYSVCFSYPRYHLVPHDFKDADLETAAAFRSSRRFPSVVWRHQGNGMVIARCSQPKVGWFGQRCTEDERLLDAIADACYSDEAFLRLKNSTKSASGTNECISHETGDETNSSPDARNESDNASAQTATLQPVKRREPNKMLVIDARSYTAAVANRAKGGGCECAEYYSKCEVIFMNLPNMHAVRKSFQSLRLLCMSPDYDQPSFLSTLETTMWLQNLSSLLRTAMSVVTAIERDCRPVLVHCSDGWDRTSQITSLAQLMLDPFYRTIEGFRVLVEREWLEYGHKFADRSCSGPGPTDPNEASPVFLQWLDCVHQLLVQYPLAFEINQTYLVKLSQHVYSRLYGTFLCNTVREREEMHLSSRTQSVWSLLTDQSIFRNPLYCPENYRNKALCPSCHVYSLRVWSAVYLPQQDNMDGRQQGYVPIETVITNSLAQSVDEVSATPGLLVKTRSCDSLKKIDSDALPVSLSCHQMAFARRNSNPNLRSFTGVSELHSSTSAMDGEQTLNQGTAKLNGEGSDLLTLVEPSSGDACLCTSASAVETSAQTCSEGSRSAVGLAQSYPYVNTVDCSTSSVTCRNPLPLTKIIKNKLASTGGGNTCTLSTSTSDISDSHVNAALPFPTVAVAELLALDIENYVDKGQGAHSTSVSVARESRGRSECSGSSKASCSTSPRAGSVAPTTDSADRHSPGGGSFSGNCKPASNKSAGVSECASSRQSNPKSAQHLSGQHSFLHEAQHTPLLDKDGLTHPRDPAMDRMLLMERRYRQQIDKLSRQLQVARFQLYRMHMQNLPPNGKQINGVLFNSDIIGGDLEQPLTNGDYHSLGNVSDTSWEAVDESTGPTLWFPDHLVSACSYCNTTFTFYNRKHHCRNCGHIFCGHCTRNSLALPLQDLPEPSRVCVQCYSKLSTASLEPNNSEEGVTNGMDKSDVSVKTLI